MKGKKRFFRDDSTLSPVLDSIPKGEMSTVIRIALRKFFAIAENRKGVVMNDPIPNGEGNTKLSPRE